MTDKMTFEEAKSVVRDHVEKSHWLLKAYAPYKCPFCLVYLQRAPDERAAWLTELIAASDDEPAVHDGLRHISAMLHGYNEPLPDPLRNWLTECLTDKRPRPARRGRDAHKNLYRDHVIQGAVRMLVDAGLPLSRNTASLPTSAADAVADVVNLDCNTVLSIVKKSY